MESPHHNIKTNVCVGSNAHLCVQKQGASGPMSLQSICPGTPKLT